MLGLLDKLVIRQVFNLNVVNGPNLFACEHRNTFTSYVSRPVRHILVHRRTTEDRGQHVHVRVHRKYSLEVNTQISDYTVLGDVTVVKVQTPCLVGGVEDHILWDQAEYERTKKK